MRKIVMLACVVGAALVVAGCHKQAPDAKAPDAAEKHLSAVDVPSLLVSGQKIVLPAVSGNPAAAYFHLENQQSGCNITPCGGGKRPPLTVLSVTVEGATRSMMHESKGNTMVELDQVTLAPGQSVDFAPGGKHLMVFGLSPKLVAGKMTMIRFKLSDGDNFAVPAKIVSASDAMGAMKM